MASISDSEPLLEASAISKRFGVVRALEAVSAQFSSGEVVAVMGENGAGKSTLMKCLAGVHQPTEGQVLHQGVITRIPNVRAAERLGIAFIHQELNLAENLDIGANVFLGREPRLMGPFFDQGGPILILTSYGTARIENVREHHGGPQECIFFNYHTRENGHVVLNFDVITDADTISHEDAGWGSARPWAPGVEDPVSADDWFVGHGVGMPLQSSNKLSNLGYAAEQIIKFYFIGVDIGYAY